MVFDNTIFDRRYFEENEFMTKYLKLLNGALDQMYNLGKFPEKHHILPRALFKLYGKDYKSTNQRAEVNQNNLIQLSIKDYILAHYYLALFSINELKKPMCYGFLAMLDRNVVKLLPSEVELLKMLPELEQIKIERNIFARENKAGKKPWNFGLTKETNEAVASYAAKSRCTQLATGKYKESGAARRGKVWVFKDTVNKLIIKEDLEQYLVNGWSRGMYTSEEGKKAKFLANTRNKGSTGKVWVNNTIENKMVDKSQLDIFLAEGWQKGRKPDKINLDVKKKNDAEHAVRMKNKKHIHNKETGECIRVDISAVEEYLNNGWALGNPKIAENNRKRKINLRGKIYINDGVHNLVILKEDLESYIAAGWHRGKKPKKN